MKYLLLALLFLNVEAQLLVDLPNGRIRGHQLQSFTNKSYHAFEGIPFAKPPLGKLRFQAPEASENWEGVLETTSLKHCCFSVTTNFDKENEDCLYLSVFTPVLNRSNNSVKLPVLFWIFGGGFKTGCAGFWPQYWMDEDIVVVMPNYRLGPFGFLATGDLTVPGNAGLKDQNLALNWTYQNIHLFGGDNQKITITGQSAGGSSVGWQMLSRKSKGMYRAAIIESGSPMNKWAYTDNGYAYTVKLATLLTNQSISNQSTAELIEYLQGVDSGKIDNASALIPEESPLPVIEPLHQDAFITEAMYELFDSGNYTQVPTIIGVNSEERITLANDVKTLKENAKEADTNLSSLVPVNFNYKPAVTSVEVGEKIRSVYVGNDTFENNLGRYIRFRSDERYTRSVIKQGELMAKYNDVYFYIFSYDGVAGDVNATFPDADSVAHAEELKYNWATNPLKDYNEADKLVHFRMMRLWTNFVKYMNPTPNRDEILQNITWQKVTQERYNFLNINASLSLEQDPKGKYFIGWERIFNDYAKRPFKTY